MPVKIYTFRVDLNDKKIVFQMEIFRFQTLSGQNKNVKY